MILLWCWVVQHFSLTACSISVQRGPLSADFVNSNQSIAINTLHFKKDMKLFGFVQNIFHISLNNYRVQCFFVKNPTWKMVSAPFVHFAQQHWDLANLEFDSNSLKTSLSVDFRISKSFLILKFPNYETIFNFGVPKFQNYF